MQDDIHVSSTGDSMGNEPVHSNGPFKLIEILHCCLYSSSQH